MKKNNQGIQGEDLSGKKNKKKTTTFTMKASSSFFQDKEEKINHSFNADIHLKNNKNFIPKDEIIKKLNLDASGEKK